jgi:hypothetical protein
MYSDEYSDYEDLYGGFSFSKLITPFKTIGNIIRGKPIIRTYAPPSVREYIEKMRGVQIDSITLFREPVKGKIKDIVNLLTLGQTNRVMKEYNYDEMYHLYMKLTYIDGRTVRIDKNHVVEIIENYVAKPGSETYAVGRVKVQMDIKEFFEGGIRSAGSEEKYWVYDAVTQNCQMIK